MAETRTTIFQMRIAPSERRMLRRLAERDGLTSSQFLRLMIRRLHADALGEVTKKVPKKK